MKNFRIKSDNYMVTAGQEIISELFENELESLNGKKTHYINWFNFHPGSVYYDNNGERYIVAEIDYENKTVKLV